MFEAPNIERNLIFVASQPESLWVGPGAYLGAHGWRIRDGRMVNSKNRPPVCTHELVLQSNGYRHGLVKRQCFNLGRQGELRDLAVLIRIEAQKLSRRCHKPVLRVAKP